MPTYEYACKSCGEHLEVVQSFKDDALTTCPACGGPLRKVFGNIGIAFKGSGFYRTDSRGGAPKDAKDAKDGKDGKDGKDTKDAKDGKDKEPAKRAPNEGGGAAATAGGAPATAPASPAAKSTGAASSSSPPGGSAAPTPPAPKTAAAG